MPKLSKISFFLFVTIYNYLWLRIILFNNFYNSYGNMGFWYGLLIIGIVFIILLSIPKRLFEKDYKDAFKKSKIKYLYSVFLILESILGLCFCAYLLSQILILEANPLIVLTFLVLTIGFLSKLIPYQIMEISTIFNIVGYLILIVSMIAYPSVDISILFPLGELNIGVIVFFSLMVLADNFSLLINKEGIKFNKYIFIFAILFALLMFALEYMVVICSVGEEFLKGVNWVGFVCLSIKPVQKYIGNFDFAYIYYIIVCCIFKYSYNLSIIRNSFAIKNWVMGVIISFLLIVSCLIIYLLVPMNNQYFSYGTILLLISSFIFFWMLKECYLVKQIEGK